MAMNINFNKRDPVYIQVVRQFKEQIATGLWGPGQEIPSRRELASQLKINPNTAQRAYKEMEEQGLIYTEGNLPSKVTEDPTVLRIVRNELINEAAESFVHAIRSINVPLDEGIEIVHAAYSKAAKGENQT